MNFRFTSMKVAQSDEGGKFADKCAQQSNFFTQKIGEHWAQFNRNSTNIRPGVVLYSYFCKRQLCEEKRLGVIAYKGRGKQE